MALQNLVGKWLDGLFDVKLIQLLKVFRCRATTAPKT